MPRLCSQPGERRPGPGAAHARSPPPARAPPSRRPGLARHGAEGRGPRGPTRSRGWKVWQGAGGRHRAWPGWGLRVRAPGMGPAPRGAGTGGVEVSAPAPRVRARPSPAAYNGVPSQRGLRGDGSVGISPRRGVSGHPCRPPPRGRRSSAWPLEPRELSSCRQGRARCSCHVLALARVAGPSPRGTADPQRDRRAARSPEPASPGGKVGGVWVCPPEMAELAGLEMTMSNGFRVQHFTVFNPLYSF